MYLNAEIIILDIFRGFIINMYHWHCYSVKIIIIIVIIIIIIIIIIINIWQMNP